MSKTAKRFRRYFEAAEKATPVQYQCMSGTTYTEKPGTYDKDLTKAIARDAILLSMAAGKDQRTKELLQGIMPAFIDLSTELERAADDLKGDRPVKTPDKEVFAKLKADLAEIRKRVKEEGIALPEREGMTADERLAFWEERAEYMESWHSVIREKYKLDFDLMEADLQEYDAEGTTLLNGLSDADRTIATNLLKMKGILLKQYLLIPVREAEHTLLKREMKRLQETAEAILDKKTRRMCPFFEEDTLESSIQETGAADHGSETLKSEVEDTKNTLEQLLQNIGPGECYEDPGLLKFGPGAVKALRKLADRMELTLLLS